MINNRVIHKICKDDISLIENYQKAIEDDTQTYCCHHRLGIELHLTRDELKQMDLYFNRPASELIFLTKTEHRQLHILYDNPMNNIESRQRISEKLKGRVFSEETRKKMSDAKKGKPLTSPVWNEGKHLTEEHKKKISEKLKGRESYIRTEETRRKQSEAHKGQIAWNKGLDKELQPTYGKTWKLKHKRGWKIDPTTGKRKYFKKE